VINLQQQKRNLLTAKQILEYFLKEDSEIETSVLSSSRLSTTDNALYEALGTIQENDNFNWRKIVKFLESVKVISYENVTGKCKPVLTQKRVDDLRKRISMEVEQNDN
jgi:hypothetical protein